MIVNTVRKSMLATITIIIFIEEEEEEEQQQQSSRRTRHSHTIIRVLAINYSTE
jgi:hypothetical protein